MPIKLKKRTMRLTPKKKVVFKKPKVKLKPKARTTRRGAKNTA